ncbi:MAG: glycosyl hydrolase 53 family protein [Bacteroidales bacterium]
MKRIYFLFLFSLVAIIVFACKEDEIKKPGPSDTDTSTFAKGADLSWVTEMESKGVVFYNRNGIQTECMALMKEMGMNSIRLRVWVNPADGWCNKTDLLVKAKRAKDLGLRIMIDFHYSDIWADPGHQTKPAEWQNLSFSELRAAVSDHTTEILTALKNWKIFPEWVQVGNETGNGMLWEDGKASVNMAQYTSLNNAGYDAVKAVFPDARVIVHLHGGQDNELYRWLLDGLKRNGGKWDVIGMSLYPDPDSWQTTNDDCINNVNDMISRYGCEVMICEVGMPYDKALTAKLWLTDLISRTKALDKDQCLGVFYWEPEAYNGWKGYKLGAFDNSGKPTVALDAFR